MYTHVYTYVDNHRQVGTYVLIYPKMEPLDYSVVIGCMSYVTSWCHMIIHEYMCLCVFAYVFVYMFTFDFSPLLRPLHVHQAIYQVLEEVPDLVQQVHSICPIVQHLQLQFLHNVVVHLEE